MMLHATLLLVLAASACTAAAQPSAKAAQTAALLQLKAALGPKVAVKSGWTTGTDFCKWNDASFDNPNFYITPTISCNEQGLVADINCAAGESGSLPGWNGRLDAVPASVWSALAPSLTILRLSSTPIQGTMPASMSALTRLEELNLSGTKIGGQLPGAWSALAALKSLELSNTPIAGTLPASWSKLTQLSSLSLSSSLLDGGRKAPRCNITGTLPASWASMDSLTRLDISNCRLSGTLPASWGKGLGYMAAIWLNDNGLSGTLPGEWKDMGAKEWEINSCIGVLVDLSSNKLSGPLPAAWSEWKALHILYVQGNRLSGSIPASWSRFQQKLVYNDICAEGGPEYAAINLSNNSFSGAVPARYLGA